MVEKYQCRQGDLLFTAAKCQSTHLTPRSDPILAHGEVTGHVHIIAEPSLDEIDMFVDEDGNIWMHSDKEIVIEHDEHDPIRLPPGPEYCMTRQREYDPIKQDRERQVND